MTQQEVIKKFMESLDNTKKKGEAALDEAIQACSTFKSFRALKNSMIKDCDNTDGDGDEFLKTYCGINLDNEDTGAITGSDAGGSTVKTASSVVPEDGSLVMLNSKTQFKINGLNVVLGKRTGSLRYSLNNVAERSFSSLSTQEKYLWRSIYTWWVKNGLDLITESYGDNYSFDENSSATTKTMYIILEDLGKNGMLAETWHGPYHERENTDNIALRINTYYYGTASGKDGEVKTEQNLDRTIAHELTHAVMCANINYFDYLPAIIKEGFADLTQGVDDYRAKDIKKLSGSSATLSKALVLNEKSFTVAGVSNPTYAGGYMLLRYLARQAGDLTIKNTSDSTAVKTFRGKDSITSSGKNVTVESGMGRDFIENSGSRVTIVGGTGNDTISNSGSKVLFKYSAGDGKDKILGFNATSTLQIGDGTTDTYFTTKSGSNVIVTVGDGKVSLMGAANLSTVNIKGKASTTLTVNDSEKSTLTIGDEIKTVDASERTKAIKITGNTLNNSIVGGSGNDTLIGGAGNDSLWGDAGADKFIYASGDGKDIIYGFDNSDMLKITGTFSASYNKFKKEIYFKVDSTSKAITLKNFTATTFNVNGKAYKISGSKLK
jgi:Ca2+-binding RTX toxin-like protein